MIYFLNVSHILAKHLWFGELFPKMYEMKKILRKLLPPYGGVWFFVNQELRG